MNLFGGSSTKQRPDSEPRSLGDHGSVFRFLGSQLEGKILRGPMCLYHFPFSLLAVMSISVWRILGEIRFSQWVEKVISKSGCIH